MCLRQKMGFFTRDPQDDNAYNWLLINAHRAIVYMAIKILASADLHLGKRTSGSERFGEETATKRTWERIVDFAVDNGVEAVLLAGDVIDRDNRYYEASRSLQDGFEELADAEIEIFAVAGNHDFDVLPQVLRNHPYDHVHLLGAGGQWETALLERRGETIQIVGWSFPQQHVLTSPLVNLANTSTDPNLFKLGMLHCNSEQATSKYAPVAFTDLQHADIDAWVLGHIHKPTIYSGDKLIRYPGSPQALSAKEPGYHGAIMLSIENRRVKSVLEISLSNCRFERLIVNVSEVNSKEDFRSLMETSLSGDANGRLEELNGTAYLVYDLHVIGRNTKGREIESWLAELGVETDPVLQLATNTQVLLRNCSASILPVVDNLENLALEKSPVGVLAETILALRAGSTTPFLERLTREWENQAKLITSSSGYQPLQAGFARSGNPRKAKDFLEKECNRLLAELLYPSN